MISWIASNVWLIPAVPLAASLLILFVSGTHRKAAASLAIIGQIVAFALSILGIHTDAANTRVSHISQFHLVHFRRTTTAHRFRPRSSRRRDARDDHAGQSMHFCFQHRLHVERQKFHTLLRVSFILLRRDARRRHREQLAAPFRLLGIGRARVVSANRILDRTTERSGRSKKSIHHHAHRRSGIFSRHSLALRNKRHASFL